MSVNNPLCDHEAFDVVVVGAGGAGLMAAHAAAQAGRRVALVEKADAIGGTTALSVGTICAAGTRLQAGAGIVDDARSHFADMEKFFGPLGHRDNAELRRVMVDNVADTVALLEKLGVTFMGPLPEPPHGKARLHAVIPHSRSFIRHLAKACRKLGVTILAASHVESLIYESGRVHGIRLAGGDPGDGTRPLLYARLGVILASGDFSSASTDYKQRYMSGALLDVGGINSLSTGDGQRMAEAVGAEVVNGDLAWGPEMRFTAPPRPSIVARMPTHRFVARTLLAAMRHLPPAWLRPLLLRFVTTYLAPSHALFRNGAILINAQGERFCDELARPQDAIGRQPGQSAFIICDDEVAQRFRAWPNFISTAPGVGYAYMPDYVRSRPDIHASAPTIEALSERLGLPRDALAATVGAHAAGLTEADREAGRLPLSRGPFHALGPVKSWIVFSEGGLRIDRDFRVLGRERAPIPGLYAAGSAGQGGVLLEGHGHHLAWAFTSGRLAGRNAALAAVPD